MSANNNRSDRIQRVVTHGPDLHKFTYKFCVRGLCAREWWYFKENFETECRFLPTSWSCKMSFRKVTGNGKVCFPFSLKRTDSDSNPVKVIFALHVTDTNFKPLFNTPIIKEERVHAGEVLEESLIENMEFPKTVYFNLLLNVVLTVRVISCHSTSFQ